MNFLRFCVAAGIWTATIAAAEPRPGEDWPRWRGPRGDGTWFGPTLPTVWPEAGLRPAWKVPCAGGYAGVTVAGGKVFLLDRPKSQPADDLRNARERVRCFDAEHGTLVWSHEYPADYSRMADKTYANGPRAAATFHDGRIFTLGTVGHACCLDAATGKVIWSRDFVSEMGAKVPQWGYAASPFVYEDTVIFHVGAEKDGCFVAVDPADGKERWRSIGDPAGYATPVLTRVGETPVLICWTPTHVRGIDARTGKPLWKVPYEITYGVSIATPLVQDDLVLVCGYWEGSKAIRLGPNPEQATLVWEENRNLRGLMSQPLRRDGLVYLLDKQYGLTCFDPRTGTKRWDDRNRLTPRGRNPHASLIRLGESDRALALNAEGELVLFRLSPEGYEETSRTKICGFTWAHPALAGNRIYARTDEELVCVPLTEGSK